MNKKQAVLKLTIKFFFLKRYCCYCNKRIQKYIEINPYVDAVELLGSRWGRDQDPN